MTEKIFFLSWCFQIRKVWVSSVRSRHTHSLLQRADPDASLENLALVASNKNTAICCRAAAEHLCASPLYSECSAHCFWDSEPNAFCQHILNTSMLKSQDKSMCSSSPASLIDPRGGCVTVLAGEEVDTLLAPKPGGETHTVRQMSKRGKGGVWTLTGLLASRFAWLAKKNKASAAKKTTVADCEEEHCAAIYSSFTWPLLPLVLSLHASSLCLHVLQEIYLLLAQELKSLASAHGERLLHTPHNPISLGKLNVLATDQQTIFVTIGSFWVVKANISDPIFLHFFNPGYLI